MWDALGFGFRLLLALLKDGPWQMDSELCGGRDQDPVSHWPLAIRKAWVWFPAPGWVWLTLKQHKVQSKNKQKIFISEIKIFIW